MLVIHYYSICVCGKKRSKSVLRRFDNNQLFVLCLCTTYAALLFTGEQLTNSTAEEEQSQPEVQEQGNPEEHSMETCTANNDPAQKEMEKRKEAKVSTYPTN